MKKRITPQYLARRAAWLAKRGELERFLIVGRCAAMTALKGAAEPRFYTYGWREWKT